MKKIMVTGANGFLGQHLCLYLLKNEMNVIPTGRGLSRIPGLGQLIYEEADLTNKKEADNLLLKHRPDIIIHAAAMSKPDECDQMQESCIKINVEATKNLLSYEVSRFIYISSDFIFGEEGPHSEEDIPAPLNFYGHTKLMAEQAVKENESPYVIIRPVFMYGKVWRGLRPTFLQWVRNNLELGKSIKVVSDQLRMPTYVEDICCGIKRVIDRNAYGIFHLAGKEVLSPYEMAVTAAETLGLDTSLIENVTSQTFHEPVRRAKKQGLRIDKAVNELDYSPISFREGVRLTFADKISMV